MAMMAKSMSILMTSRFRNSIACGMGGGVVRGGDTCRYSMGNDDAAHVDGGGDGRDDGNGETSGVAPHNTFVRRTHCKRNKHRHHHTKEIIDNDRQQFGVATLTTDMIMVEVLATVVMRVTLMTMKRMDMMVFGVTLIVAMVSRWCAQHTTTMSIT